MIAPRFVPLVLKQVFRHRVRSLLTLGGVTVAMFLFAVVQAMQAGVQAATVTNATDTTLVVYRKDRYCPFASRLPQSYLDRIARIPGVESVVPVKIVVSNCRTSLDVVTFRGCQKTSSCAAWRHDWSSSAEHWASGNGAATPPCWAKRWRAAAG